MRYRIIWHDAEDDRTGSPFSVEADSPSDAFWLAVAEIESWKVKGSIPSYDIECLVDENDQYHHPDFFLAEEKKEPHAVTQTHLEELRLVLSHGEGISQDSLNKIASELETEKARLRPNDKTEPLPLFDTHGKPLGTTAPRWICHLLALRHRCAHILLLWKSPALGEVLVLQIRDWNKDDSPGHIDISVGGHMKASEAASAEDTAFTEMLEETGLTRDDLEGALQWVGGYSFDESRHEEGFWNSEWRDVYVARVKQDRFGRIRFPDGEVAGVVVIELRKANRLLEQVSIPMASALRGSLPKCLESLQKTQA